MNTSGNALARLLGPVLVALALIAPTTPASFASTAVPPEVAAPTAVAAPQGEVPLDGPLEFARARSAPAQIAKRWHTISFVRLRQAGNGRPPVSRARFRNVVAQVDDFYRRSTGDKVRFQLGTVVKGWHTVPAGLDPCTVDAAKWAGRAFDLSARGRNHVVAYSGKYCSWAGVAEVPGHHVSITRQSTTYALAHELGHNLGLYHSNDSRCTVLFTNSCQDSRDDALAQEYGDGSDIMGGAEPGSGANIKATRLSTGIGVLGLEQLGLLRVKDVVEFNPADAPQRIVLAPRDSSSSDPKFLKMPWRGRDVWFSVADMNLVAQVRAGISTLRLPVGRTRSNGPIVGGTYPVTKDVVLDVESIGRESVLSFRRQDGNQPTAVALRRTNGEFRATWQAPQDSAAVGWRVQLVGSRNLYYDPKFPTPNPSAVVTQEVEAGARSVTFDDVPDGRGWQVQVTALLPGNATGGTSVAVP